MKLAIMQPYFFPYIGYWQLLAAVDRFVIYDDVSFIKQGWINRNQILVGCQPYVFSIPLRNASSFKLICDTRLALVKESRHKLFRTIEQAYGKAPYFDLTFSLLKNVCERESEFMGKLAFESILAVADYIGINTEIIPTSRNYNNDNLKGAERVLDICRRETAKEYYNLPGGEGLYDCTTFANADIGLHFVKPKQAEYRQFGCAFVPYLSIIDVMMFNDRDTIRGMLSQYELT